MTTPPETNMAGETEFGYRTWAHRRRAAWLAFWPIARSSLWLVVRRKGFWILLGLALVHFLFYFALIYMKGPVAVENPGVERFIDRLLPGLNGDAETYRDFMRKQELVTMLLLAFGGSILVGNDHRLGGLTFYLSRRLNRWHYYFGKLLATSILVSSITLVPAAILYLEYGLLTESVTYLWDEANLLVSIVVYGACISLVLSLLFFALASWLQRTVPLLLTWAGIFVFLPAIAELLRETNDSRNWMLLNLWRNLHLLGHWIFGTLNSVQRQQLPSAVTVLILVSVISFVISLPRLRAVKVVG